MEQQVQLGGGRRVAVCRAVLWSWQSTQRMVTWFERSFNIHACMHSRMIRACIHAVHALMCLSCMNHACTQSTHCIDVPLMHALPVRTHALLLCCLGRDVASALRSLIFALAIAWTSTHRRASCRNPSLLLITHGCKVRCMCLCVS